MQRIVLLFAVILFFCSTACWALADGSLQLGKRWSAFSASGNEDKILATELTIAGHVDPIPLVPVAFGLFLSHHDYDISDSKSVMSGDELKGNQFGLEVVGWMPLDVFNLTPYAKLAYAVWGEYRLRNNNVTTLDPLTDEEANLSVQSKYLSRGPKFAAGLRWSPIALLHGTIETFYSRETWKIDSLKIGSVSTSTSSVSSPTVNSYGILIGAEVRI